MARSQDTGGPSDGPSAPASEPPPNGSRRRFLKLLAAGSAAVATSAVPAVTRSATSTKKAASAAPTAKVRAEIESQKRYVAKALGTIRAFPLPDGSDPSFVFIPLEPHRNGAGSGGSKTR